MQARFRGLHGERPDYIVGFVSGRIYDGNIEGFAQANDVWKLRRQVVGHLQAIRFVVGKRFVAKGLLA